jgi:glycosyltransferase involved in cell wall biosynthesis
MRPLVIIPTYNERGNLPAIVAQLLAIAALRILVVDDGSPDGTGTIADALAATSGGRLSVIHRSGRRGLGRSYVDGMRHAIGSDATHVCHMDADLSHDPADLPRLLQASAAADLVIGSRYVAGGRLENWGMHRSSACRLAGSGRTDTPSRWKWRGRPTAQADGLPRNQSRSSSGGRGPRSCRAGSSPNQSSCRGGWWLAREARPCPEKLEGL